MKQEILALKGRISETKKDIRDTELSFVGKITQIRILADLYEDKLHINTDALLVAAKELKETQSKLLELKTKLTDMEDALNV